jgi:hypothetical protein
MYIFYKIYLQWIYWTLFFLSHVVLKILPVISPRPDIDDQNTTYVFKVFDLFN